MTSETRNWFCWVETKRNENGENFWIPFGPSFSRCSFTSKKVQFSFFCFYNKKFFSKRKNDVNNKKRTRKRYFWNNWATYLRKMIGHSLRLIKSLLTSHQNRFKGQLKYFNWSIWRKVFIQLKASNWVFLIIHPWINCFSSFNYFKTSCNV